MAPHDSAAALVGWADSVWEDDLALFDDLDHSSDESALTSDEGQSSTSDSLSDDLQFSDKAKPKRKRETAKLVGKNGGIYVKRRADGRYLTHVVLPKILKSDIRRSFPQIYCNVHNSDNPEMMQGFLDTFATNDLVFHHIFSGGGCVGGSDLALAAQITLIGSARTVRFWDRLTRMIPDKACRLLNAQVTARSDGTGLVQFEMEMCGTIMLRDGDNPPCQQMHDFDNDASDCTAHSAQADCALQRVESHGDAMLCHAMGSMRLITMQAKARVQFHLDAQNIIRQIEFACGGDSA